MGKSLCGAVTLLINLFGGGENFLVIDYNYTFGRFGSGSRIWAFHCCKEKRNLGAGICCRHGAEAYFSHKG